MKKSKPHNESHVSKTNQPMGDLYGVGIKNKVGKIVDQMAISPISKKNMGKPPKSLA